MSLARRSGPARRLLAGAALIALMAGGEALGQEPALAEFVNLATDPETPIVITGERMEYDTDGRVARAIGNAEAFYGERALGADTLVYDAANGAVSASGNVALRNDDGSYLFADEARLDVDLENGTIGAPKILLSDGTRLSAVAGERIEDRFTVLDKVVYSPCNVCEADPVPLWRVRADRVIHDEQSRDIIYEDATFDIEGVSVMYLPWFRHPDPTVKRRSGFLTPKVGRDETIGLTAKQPYHLVLAPNRDLTITPYLTSKDGLIMEGEYRARTEAGQYLLWGSATRNDRRTGKDEWRGALNGNGRFDLTRDWDWGYDLDWASDDTYLRRYRYTETDRVRSRLFADRQTDRMFAEANLHYFQSFRSDEPDEFIPQALPELRYRHRVLEDPSFGVASVGASTLHLERETGRDITRIGGEADWERPFVTDGGVLVTPFADLRADAYVITDDPTFSEDVQARATGAAGIDVRMPFIAENALGQHIVEPIAQLVLAPNATDSLDIPNEDSLDIEFDETNLFARGSRFPGRDRFETGSRLNAGVRYAYRHEDGLEFEAVYGRVFRVDDNPDFSDSSGLRDAQSDHVGSWRLRLAPSIDITHRFRLDGDSFDISRNEVYLSGSHGPVSAAASYVFLEADPLAGFVDDREEIAGNLALKLDETTTAYGRARHDLEDSRFISMLGGLRYENECCLIDFSVDRRFNDDRDAESSTNFGLEVRLKSLGS